MKIEKISYNLNAILITTRSQANLDAYRLIDFLRISQMRNASR